MPDNIPQKCEKCSKSFIVRYHSKCSFCQDMEFEEGILCELNRAVQEFDNFKCHAFEPKLKIVNSEKQVKKPPPPPFNLKQEQFSGFLNTDKIKYQRALALQKLNNDPEGIFIQLKYHISWNVCNRIPLFIKSAILFEPISLIFYQSSEIADSLVHLLYLARDHVHLFLESDGEQSVEEMVNKIKKHTEEKIIKEYPIIKEKSGSNNGIWDNAYFAQTVS